MDAIEVVFSYLSRGGICHTRLRERSSGDAHDAPAGMIVDGLTLDESQLLAALAQLENQGLVETRATVNPHDSSEYDVMWTVVRSDAMQWPLGLSA
jgi:hypothetical protein